MYVLKNIMIYDYKNFINDGYIRFSDHIIDVGKMDAYKEMKDDEVIDASGKLVLPGFVCGHTHFYSTFARGISLNFSPRDFLDILKQMWWKIDRFLDEDDIYYSALMGAIDQLKCGTTSFIDHHASQLVKGSLNQVKKAVVKDLGLRVVLGFETSDRFDVSQAIEENLIHINEKPTAHCSSLFGMHASLSLSQDSLLKIKNTLNGAGIHIHVAESLQDQEDCIKKYNMRVVERLDSFGLINENSLLVHCTHINDNEIDIIKKRNATIAINPTSNLNNAVGISNIRKLLDKGIPVIIGNDGLIQSQANELMNAYYLAHYKNQDPLGFSMDDLLKIIHHTYDYINRRLKTSLGSIVTGAQSDLIVVDYQPYTEMNQNNAFSHVFFGVYPGLKPEMVFSSGKRLINNYQLSRDLIINYTEAQKQSKKLWKRIEKEGENIEFKY